MFLSATMAHSLKDGSSCIMPLQCKVNLFCSLGMRLRIHSAAAAASAPRGRPATSFPSLCTPPQLVLITACASF